MRKKRRRDKKQRNVYSKQLYINQLIPQTFLFSYAYASLCLKPLMIRFHAKKSGKYK